MVLKRSVTDVRAHLLSQELPMLGSEICVCLVLILNILCFNLNIRVYQKASLSYRHPSIIWTFCTLQVLNKKFKTDRGISMEFHFKFYSIKTPLVPRETYDGPMNLQGGFSL